MRENNLVICSVILLGLSCLGYPEITIPHTWDFEDGPQDWTFTSFEGWDGEWDGYWESGHLVLMVNSVDASSPRSMVICQSPPFPATAPVWASFTLRGNHSSPEDMTRYRLVAFGSDISHSREYVGIQCKPAAPVSDEDRTYFLQFFPTSSQVSVSVRADLFSWPGRGSFPLGEHRLFIEKVTLAYGSPTPTLTPTPTDTHTPAPPPRPTSTPTGVDVVIRVGVGMGAPGGQGDPVPVDLENPSVPVRGLSLTVQDVPDILTAVRVRTTDRTQEGFLIQFNDHGLSGVDVTCVGVGVNIPPGSGPIFEIDYDVSPHARGQVPLKLRSVQAAGPRSQPLVVETVDGGFVVN